VVGREKRHDIAAAPRPAVVGARSEMASD